MNIDAIARTIQDQDFDHPFTLHADGSLTDADNVWAPEVYHDDTDDVTIDGIPWKDTDRWHALAGLTGQYGYNGPTMHASEQIGRAMASRMIGMCDDGPRVFVATTVEVLPDDDDTDTEPAGWIMLMHRPTAD
jgi:hypothetical protein